MRPPIVASTLYFMVCYTTVNEFTFLARSVAEESSLLWAEIRHCVEEHYTYTRCFTETDFFQRHICSGCNSDHFYDEGRILYTPFPPSDGADFSPGFPSFSLSDSGEMTYFLPPEMRRILEILPEPPPRRSELLLHLPPPPSHLPPAEPFPPLKGPQPPPPKGPQPPPPSRKRASLQNIKQSLRLCRKKSMNSVEALVLATTVMQAAYAWSKANRDKVKTITEGFSRVLGADVEDEDVRSKTSRTRRKPRSGNRRKDPSARDGKTSS